MFPLPSACHLQPSPVAVPTASAGPARSGPTPAPGSTSAPQLTVVKDSFRPEGASPKGPPKASPAGTTAALKTPSGGQLPPAKTVLIAATQGKQLATDLG